MNWDILKRWFGRAETTPEISADKSQNQPAAISAPSSDEDEPMVRDISMEGPLPVEIEYDSCGGNCPVQAEGTFSPVQAEGTFNGYSFYFRARGEGWSMEIGLPKRHVGWYGVAAWEYEEEYSGSERDAGWMGLDEAKLFIEKSARLWHMDKGWEACDKLAAEIREEYRLRGELEEMED